MKKTSNKNQHRKCRLNPKIKCEDCKKETCPFIYCQHIDCMACEKRATCPMCEGKCKKCKKYTYCVVFNA